MKLRRLAWPLMALLLAVFTAAVMIANVGGQLWSSAGGPPRDVTLSVSPAPTFRPSPSPTATPSPVFRPRVTPQDFHAGMTLVLYGNDSQLEAKVVPLLDRLVELNVNTLSVAFPFHTRTWTASVVDAPDELTPSPETLARLVRLARERRFTVMLRPVLDEQSLIADGQWRGSIRPSNVRAWFESYGELLLRYAALGQRERVGVLCVGTELVSLEQEKQQWSALIAKIRSVFDGQLTYCANWDSFTRVSFWDALDFIGVDAFFPLSASVQADAAELAVAWQAWVRRVTEFQQALGKPVVLTEIGVTSQRGSHRQPWVWDQGTPIDLEGQARYYRATCEAWKPSVTGMYWWAVDPGLPPGPATDVGYNPLGKPAEFAMRECFG